jgi:hypothetical protein
MGWKQIIIGAVFACAAIATLFGGLALMAWDHQPGVANRPPDRWPDHSTIARTSGEPQLLVFAHPLCACTAASLEDLQRVLSQLSITNTPRPHVSVLFSRPLTSKAWKAGPTWLQARDEIKAEVQWDDGGVESKRFGAATSGAVLLYSASGKLLFNGGLTGSRGHAGDNNGMSQLTTALATGKPDVHVPSVFGCSLAGLSLPGIAR